jgi:NitT/TauT family transport system permease protein
VTAATSRGGMLGYRLTLAASIVAAWQLASGSLVPEFFISKPTAILAALWQQVTTGNLFFHVGITATEAFAGFAFGAIAGVTAGVLLGRIPSSPTCCSPSSWPSTACRKSRSRRSSSCGSASASG